MTTQAMTVSNSPRERLAERFGVTVDALDMAMTTVMPQGANNAERVAVLIIADQYGLNPITKEIHAFKGKGGAIVPIVGVDGWMRIVNSHPQCDGVEFEYLNDANGDLEGITTVIYRKDRTRPTRVTEWMDECKRPTEPWRQSPARMLRHKSFIQCARLAFGFSGIYDPDEGERIMDAVVVEERPAPASPAPPRKRGVAAIAERLHQEEPEPEPVDTSEYREEAVYEALEEPVDDSERDALLEAYKDGLAHKADAKAECPYHIMEQPWLQEAWSKGHSGQSFDIADILSRMHTVG